MGMIERMKLEHMVVDVVFAYNVITYATEELKRACEYGNLAKAEEIIQDLERACRYLQEAKEIMNDFWGDELAILRR